jgi:hypothetical protein
MRPPRDGWEPCKPVCSAPDGTTHFTVDADGDFKLESSVTRDEQPHSWSGKLPADDRNAFLRAIESTRLLDVPSSTRNIGDDEEPIIVTVREGKLVHEVRSGTTTRSRPASRPSRRTC